MNEFVLPILPAKQQSQEPNPQRPLLLLQRGNENVVLLTEGMGEGTPALGNDRAALPGWSGGAPCTAKLGPGREGNVVRSAKWGVCTKQNVCTAANSRGFLGSPKRPVGIGRFAGGSTPHASRAGRLAVLHL